MILSELARGSLPDLHRLLSENVASGAVRIPLTRSLLDEVARTAVNNPDLHSRACELLRSLCGGLVLGAHDWRVGKEARSGGRLTFEEACGDPCIAEAVHFGLANRGFAEDRSTAFRDRVSLVHRRTQEAVDGFDELLSLLGRKRTKASLKKKFSDPVASTLEMATLKWESVCSQLGIVDGGPPSIDRCPSLWFHCSHYVGSTWFALSSQGSLQAGDVGDRQHASEAAYVDRFVTNDKKLLRVMAWASVPTDRFVRTDQFTDELRTLG